MRLDLLFLLCLAGALGSLARYALTILVGAILGSAFPWGVFVVNIVGCFLFGGIWALAGIHHILGESARFVLLTGFAGAFTTFSTFVFDAQQMLEGGRWMALALQTGGQVILGILALRLGIRCAALFA